MKTLERRLGLPTVIAISIGAMLGSGLFVLPGLAATLTGPSMWLAYIAAGLCVLPAALSKSELATAMPTAGGSYVFLERTFGPLLGTIGGIGLWLSLLLKSAFALIGMTWYLREVIGIDETTTALVILTAVLALNFVGVKKVGAAQLFMVVVSMIGLLVLAVWGTKTFNYARMDPFLPNGEGGFILAVAVIYISYAGVTKIAAIAEEVKNPDRNLPLGILISLGLVTVLYGVLTLVLAGNVNANLSYAEGGLQGDFHPIFSLAYAIAGKGFAIVIAILGTLTMTSMANAGVLAASRFPFAMSRNELLPASLSKIHPKYLTPGLAILLTGLAMAVAIVFLDLPKIAKLASSFKILVFIGINLTVIVLRESAVGWYQPSYRSPLYPWIQIIGIFLGIVLLVMLGVTGLIAAVGIAIPGWLIFLKYGRKLSHRKGVFGDLGPRKELILEAQERAEELRDALPGEAAAVGAFFGHERSPETLVEVGASLAHGQKLEIIHVTHVPEQSDLEAFLEEDAHVTNLRRRIDIMASEEKLDVEFDAVVTRDVVETIHDTTSRVHCHWLLMEWEKPSKTRIFHTSPILWLTEHLSCNMALFKDAGIRYIRKIMVLAEPGPNDGIVVSTADHLAELYGAEVTFVRFVGEGDDDITIQGAMDYMEQVQQLCDKPEASKCRVIQCAEEISAIAEISVGYDLLVLAGQEKTSLWQQFKTPRVDRITDAAACSVLQLRTPKALAQNFWQIRRKEATPSVDILSYIHPACVDVGSSVSTKEELFSHIATLFSDNLKDLKKEDIEEGLWARERSYNTAVGKNVGMPHVTLSGITRPYLGIVITSNPVDYQSENKELADVFFVTLSPPEEREKHLLLLAEIAKLIQQTEFLQRLRDSKDTPAIMLACQQSEADLSHS